MSSAERTADPPPPATVLEAAGPGRLPALVGSDVRPRGGQGTKGVAFQGAVPSTKLSELDDRRLCASVGGERPAGVVSEDAGKSWSASFPYLQDGDPLDGSPFCASAAVPRIRTWQRG
jgi:hypothetical protein